MAGPPVTSLGMQIRRSRDARRLSQRALARLAGVSLGTVQAIEQGQRQPRVESLVRLVDALGIPREPLLTRFMPGSYAAVTTVHDLTDEDLAVARVHHHATSDVRRCVQRVLFAASSRVVALPLVTPDDPPHLTLADYRLIFRILDRLNALEPADRQSALHALAITLDLSADAEEVSTDAKRHG